MLLWVIFVVLTALAVTAEYLDISQSEKDFKAGAVEGNTEKTNYRPSALDLVRTDWPWYTMSAGFVVLAFLHTLAGRYALFGSYSVSLVIAYKHFKGYKAGVEWLKKNKG